MLSYIQGLQPSTMRFLYFCHNDGSDPKYKAKFKAYVNSCAYELRVTTEDDPMYVVPSKNGDYCYIYKQNDIKYNVDTEKGNVVGYKKQTGYTPIETQGGGGSPASWGEHLTVGVENKLFEGSYVLDTHYTFYSPNSDRVGDIHRESRGCKLKLNPQAIETEPNEQTKVIIGYRFYTSKMIQSYDFDPTLITLIRHLYHRILGTSLTGGKRRITPKIHVGARGGRYIIKHKKKVYLKGQHGGHYPWWDEMSRSYTDDFVKFLSLHLIENVHTKHRDLIDTILVDDGSTDHFMMLYVYGDMDEIVLANKYEVPKEAVFELYAKYLAVLSVQRSAAATANAPEPTQIVGNLMNVLVKVNT